MANKSITKEAIIKVGSFVRIIIILIIQYVIHIIFKPVITVILLKIELKVNEKAYTQ